MAIESALIPVCLPLIQFSLKQPERFVQRNRTKIIKNVSALRLGLQHTRFRSAFDDPPIIEQMRHFDFDGCEKSSGRTRLYYAGRRKYPVGRARAGATAISGSESYLCGEEGGTGAYHCGIGGGQG